MNAYKRSHLLMMLVLGLFAASQLHSTPMEESSPKTTQDDSFHAESFSHAPEWAKNVVWYQIFLERFQNGDSANDPRPQDLKSGYPGFVPENWTVTPWTHDWYEPEPWVEDVVGKTALDGYEISTFSQWCRLRRYGGDLQGVFDKLDYLESLGINAIYFNPLNDAPSEHKYDARNWRHIDRNFGPSPDLDEEIMASEDPGDPSTWKFTTADKMFLDLLKELKRRGIRVILDYSWNHTGLDFWAWKDILKNQKESEYAEWYWVDAFDDPNTPDNEFSYRGWFGVKDLPEIRKTEYHDHSQKITPYEGNLHSQAAKEHIFSVSQRWLDPDGDGDPSDGVDGFRLDVAAELPLGFWREYRIAVRSVNPEALLIGEIWWEMWPDDLLDPEIFLRGDIFDSVMNYRWYRSARQLFANAPKPLKIADFVDEQQRLISNLRKGNSYAMMNLMDSHDTPRVLTSLFNGGRYKFNTEPSADPDYKIHKPDSETYETLKLLLAHQFTYVGSPHIWAGGEMGMWGADMSDSRKPLIWPDYEFEAEKSHPNGNSRPLDEVKFDKNLFQYYQTLIQIRKSNPVLALGDIDYFLMDEDRRLLGYSRFDDNHTAYALFNLGEKARWVEIDCEEPEQFVEVLKDRKTQITEDDKLRLQVSGRSAAILVSSEN